MTAPARTIPRFLVLLNLKTRIDLSRKGRRIESGFLRRLLRLAYYSVLGTDFLLDGLSMLRQRRRPIFGYFCSFFVTRSGLWTFYQPHNHLKNRLTTILRSNGKFGLKYRFKT